MRIAVLLFFLLGLTGCFTEEAGSSIPNDACTQLCDGTYPEHTYPRPEDNLACNRGCRLAQVDALIAWPFQPSPSSCEETCSEAYSATPPELNACKVGCSAATIHHMVPDREEIYNEDLDSDGGILFMLFDSSFFQLSQQAEKLLQLLPCYSSNTSSSVVIIEDKVEDSMEIQFTFGFDFVPLSNSDQVSSDYLYVQEEPKSPTPIYYYCPWKTVRYSVAGKLLLLAALGLIMTSLFTCCFSSLLSEGKGKQEKINIPKHCLSDSVFSSTSLLKSPPPAYSPGYPQPVPYYGQKTTLAV